MDYKIRKVRFVFNILGMCFFLMSGLYLAMNWSIIPEKIALHFDIFGNPDRFFSKNFLALILFTGIFIYMLLFVTSIIIGYLSCSDKKDSGVKSLKLEIEKTMLVVSGFFVSIFYLYAMTKLSNGMAIAQVMVYFVVVMILSVLAVGSFAIIKIEDR